MLGEFLLPVGSYADSRGAIYTGLLLLITPAEVIFSMRWYSLSSLENVSLMLASSLLKSPYSF